MNAWLSSPRAPTPDVTDFVDGFGPALVAANLAGRYDVEETPALATAATQHARLEFAEQIAFFRSKLDLPTQSWTDIWEAEHDRAFVVAGAAHANLVADLRSAVDSAIAEGTTLAKFRQDFDQIAAQHGWSYKGGRTWRTRVIYDTNLRQSYSAGRFQQMKAGAARRPFWRYRHSHASEDPREEHLAWDGLVLPHDDPWWDTHFPINGWGCKCYTEGLNIRDMMRLGKSGPDTAPPLNMRTVTVGQQGPTPRTVQVPEGIDPGFAYTPGRSVIADPPTPADPFAIGEISRADATVRQVGRQAGSNPGGLYEGTDGIRRYVKFYQDPAQAYGEAVANRTYRELGIDAPVSHLVRDGDAIVGIASDIIDHEGTLGGRRRLGKGRSKNVLKGFAADVWMANWDAVGLNLDNVVLTRAGRDAVARIDQGGALLMRARAGRKPVERLAQITEWDGFADPGRNPAYARVFAAAEVDGADALGRQAIRQIDDIATLGRRTDNFARLAPDVAGVAEADVAAIRSLLARRARLLQSQIKPRVREAMRSAPNLPDYEERHRRALGSHYRTALNAGRSKVAAGADRRGMTDPELATTWSYTTEQGGRWYHYDAVNRTLRTHGGPDQPLLPQRVDDYRLTLNDALDRLPDQAGTFWRGVRLSPAEIASYELGSVQTWAGFSSTSRRQERAFPRNTIFEVRARRGKDIRAFSNSPGEDEALLRAGFRFRVLQTADWPDGRKWFLVEEVDD